MTCKQGRRETTGRRRTDCSEGDAATWTTSPSRGSALGTIIVDQQAVRPKLDAADLLECFDQRCQVAFEQGQQVPVGDVPGSDDQEPAWRP